VHQLRLVTKRFFSNRDGAQPQLKAVLASNRRGLFWVTIPYKTAITAAMASAFISIPMIFDYNTVLTFNELYVTAGEYFTHFTLA
jgi:hypothetical protein